MNNLSQIYKNNKKIDEEKPVLIDSHVHTKGSFDGSLNMHEIINECNKNDVKMIVVTDHNTIKYVSDFIKKEGLKQEYSAYVIKNGVKIIPGIEVSTKLKLDSGEKVKIHSVVVAPKKLDTSSISKLCEIKFNHDAEANLAYVKKINTCTNLKITKEMVLEYIYEKKISNPHFQRLHRKDIINIIYKNNLVRDLNKIQQRLPKFSEVPYLELDLVDVSKLARLSKGVVIGAHLGVNIRPEIQEEVARHLISNGFDGVEIDYYANPKIKSDILNAEFERLHKNTGGEMLTTGGSDFHNRSKKIGYVDMNKLYENKYTLPKKINDLHKKRVIEKQKQNELLYSSGYIKNYVNIVDIANAKVGYIALITKESLETKQVLNKYNELSSLILNKHLKSFNISR